MTGVDSTDALRAGGPETPPALRPATEGRASKTDTVTKAIKTPKIQKYLVRQRIRASLTENQIIRTAKISHELAGRLLPVLAAPKLFALRSVAHAELDMY
jgi:hypothetical protein